eukprot:2949547-Pyramimonas_sp.AAC.1
MRACAALRVANPGTESSRIVRAAPWRAREPMALHRTAGATCPHILSSCRIFLPLPTSSPYL